MRVIVTASRTWDRDDVVWACLDIIATEAAAVGETHLVVVHGCAEGGDKAADRWVRKGGHPLDVRAERHPPNYAKHGRQATWIRNREIVRRGADVCLAFIRDGSNGATGTADWAEAAEIPTRRIDYDSLPERAS
jgi:hypothetical protein